MSIQPTPTHTVNHPPPSMHVPASYETAARRIARLLALPPDRVGWVEGADLARRLHEQAREDRRAAGVRLVRPADPALIVRPPWAAVVVARGLDDAARFEAAWRAGRCAWLLDALAVDYPEARVAVPAALREGCGAASDGVDAPPPWAAPPTDVAARVRAWAAVLPGAPVVPGVEAVCAWAADGGAHPNAAVQHASTPSPTARDLVWIRPAGRNALGAAVWARWARGGASSAAGQSAAG